MACRKRDVEERGRPHTFLPKETTMYGRQLLRHGRGNPDTDQCWNLRIDTDQGVRQAAQNWKQACPPYASGESYRASYAAVGKAHHVGKDSTAARRPDRTLIPDMLDRNQLSQPPYGLEQTGVYPARKRMQPRNRRRENRTSGTVRGTSGNRRSYRSDAAMIRSKLANLIGRGTI